MTDTKMKAPLRGTACVGTFEALPEFSLHVELDLR